MSEFTKRDATPVEVENAIANHAKRWNAMNPNHAIPVEEFQAKNIEAEGKGYRNEVCSCGVVFCAFHDYTTCRAAGCPFSDGVSVLERMAKSSEQEFRKAPSPVEFTDPGPPLLALFLAVIAIVFVLWSL